MAQPRTLSLQAATPRLILASASTARLAVLQQAGIVVDVQPSAVDEAVAKIQAQAAGLDADATALLLAELKARSVPEPDALVIGADQLLVCDGERFDKPADLDAAADHLRRLSGRTHVLHTAVVVTQAGRVIWSCAARPSLRMRVLSEPFIATYVAAEGEALLSSVGAYRLEGRGIQLFDQIDGERSAILGLPLLPLLELLRTQAVLCR